jgi:hypothetical protein
MQRFIQKYKEQSVTSKDFSDTFEEFISNKFANETKAKIEILSQLKWDQWLYTSGAFPQTFDFSTVQSN